MRRVTVAQPMWEEEKERFNKIIEEHAAVHGTSGGFPVCPLHIDCTISEEGIKLLKEIKVEV